MSERLLRPQEPACDTEPDVVRRDERSQPPRLLDALRREALAGRRARRQPVAVRPGERVPGEQNVLDAQSSTDR
jgi:hypothetical protein